MGRDIGVLTGIINGKRKSQLPKTDPVSERLLNAVIDVEQSGLAALPAISEFYGLSPVAIERAFKARSKAV